MTTYKGLPGPHICDFWEREKSAANYDDGSSFQIGRIDMIANTGTYLDAPFHRYADGADFADMPLASLAELPGIVVRRPWENEHHGRHGAFEGLDVGGKAVLVHTGWDRHWGTDAYERPSVPDRRGRANGWSSRRGAGRHRQPQYRRHARRPRPVHTMLLGAGIPICEHMTNLGSLPDEGFRFTAVPPKMKAWAPSRCAPTLCSAERRLPRASWDDRAVEIVGAAMYDRQAELGINDPRARSAAVVSDDDQPPIDLLPPVHAGGIFLADEAALGEADAVQLGGIAFEPEQVAKLGAAFAHAEAQAMVEPAGAGGRRGQPAAAERRQARVGLPWCSVRRPMDGQRCVALDLDRPAQAVDGEALDEVVDSGGFAIEKQVFAVRPDDEIEQALALRGEQASPNRKRASYLLVTRPLRKPRTSSPERRTRARSVRVVAAMPFS